MDDQYKCYKNVDQAFLIVDDLPNFEIDSGKYEQQTLATFFAKFQPPGCWHRWIYNPDEPIQSGLPEDFFLVGSGRTVRDAEYRFALCADVSPDLKGVKLWFINDDLDARIYDASNKMYVPCFRFEELKLFVTGVLAGD